MNALCLVAHPDDCVIFAFGYIYHHPEFTWTIAYLTYQEHEARSQELKNFWNRRGISCVFLGFEDDWHDQELQKFTRWSAEEAQHKCWELAQEYDLVLTHDQFGDYGHIHHQLIHDAVKNHRGLVSFAPPGQGTVTYSVPSTAYSLEELPMHGTVIAGFHSSGHQNSYKEMS